MVPFAGGGSPLLWVYHRLRGREKLEQSKTSWRLGLGNLLNGPICPLCLPECHNAESGDDDSRRPSYFPSLSLPSPTVGPNPYPPLLFTLNSFLSGILALTPILLRAGGWSHICLRCCFSCTPWGLALGALCTFPSFQGLSSPLHSSWHGKGEWAQGAGSLGTHQAVSGALPSLGTLTLPTSMQDKVVCFSSLWVVKSSFLFLLARPRHSAGVQTSA